MKIIREKNNDVKIKINAKKEFLKRVVSKEEAEKNKLTMYVNEEWNYVIGKEEVGFCFLDASFYNVYGVDDEEILDILYEIELYAGGEVFTVQLSQKEYYEKKWLEEIKVQEIIIISKSNYQKLIKEIIPKKRERVYFKKIGLHKFKDKCYYVTSNLAITSEGIDRNVSALTEGFNFVYDEEINERESINKFIKYNEWNMKIFFPVHCMPFIAIMRSLLNEEGMSAGVTLWIDGKRGSGKTHLAIYLGDIFNRGGSWNALTKHVHSMKEKTKDITQEVQLYRNAVFILDDVKKEETVRNRENAKNLTDLIVRSVYRGKFEQSGMDDDAISMTSIVTGEFFKEQASTISRIIYLNIDSFMKEGRNKEYFGMMQKDKFYLSNFMRFFLQWFLKKQEEDYAKVIAEKYLEQRRLLDGRFSGDGSERISETTATFQLVAQVLNEYLLENASKYLGEEDIEKFYKKGMEVLENLGECTLNKSSDYKEIIADRVYSALVDMKIKDSRYEEAFLEAVEITSYMNEVSEYDLMKGKEVQFGEYSMIHKPINKILLLRMEHDGILLYSEGKEILLVRQDILCEKVREKVLEKAKNWNMKIHASELEDEKILKCLLEKQVLYSEKRNDGTFNKIIHYPKFKVDEFNKDVSMNEKDIFKMVKVNIDTKVHVADLINNMEKISLETWKSDYASYAIAQQKTGGSIYYAWSKEIEGAIMKANKFSDLK